MVAKKNPHRTSLGAKKNGLLTCRPLRAAETRIIAVRRTWRWCVHRTLLFLSRRPVGIHVIGIGSSGGAIDVVRSVRLMHER